MSKRIYLVALLLLSLQFCVSTVSGQQVRVMPANPSNASAADPSVVAGHFEMDRPDAGRGITEHVNVNYSLWPAPFTNTMNLSLNTPDPTLFHAAIIDRQGKQVLQWSPAETSHRYKTTFDISGLARGDYKFSIYDAGKQTILYSIPFSKK